jgi:ribosomal protein S18 acetylase RimI-like enzyme
MGELLLQAFHYPENETWSVQADEKESLVDMLRSLRRLWPLIRLIQLISPSLRDVLLGYVWEEDERMAGMVSYQRLGATDTWYITNVAVLPDYRRRGMARKLVQNALDAIGERGGKVVLLDVIAGNVPAYTLYERVGFEHFTGRTVFDYKQDQAPPEIDLPEGYVVSPFDPFEWRTRYELARRIIPADVQKYEPIEEARYRRPRAMRLLIPIIRRASGMREDEIVLRAASDEQVVALAECATRTRPGGVNQVGMRLDPAHAELAPYLVHHLIRTAQQLSPGRRIEFNVSQWQDEVIQVAGAAGCVKRLEYHRMGLSL